MRTASLVRAWLYSFRGFVVMTMSLAIAFSVAVTGPPTDSEIRLVSAALARIADAFGEDVEASAVDLCPALPPEARALCAPPARAEPAQAQPEPVAPVAPETPATTVDVALDTAQPPPSPTTAASDTQLLGAPRAQTPARRAGRHSVSALNRADARRAEPRRTRRTPALHPVRQRAAPVSAPASESPPVAAPAPVEPAPAIRPTASIEEVLREWTHAAQERDAEAQSEPAYEDDDEDRAEAWRWRERRERRRRYFEDRQSEREAGDEPYEDVPDEEYYGEDDPAGAR